jgi:hypothetical protein
MSKSTINVSDLMQNLLTDIEDIVEEGKRDYRDFLRSVGATTAEIDREVAKKYGSV